MINCSNFKFEEDKEIYDVVGLNILTLSCIEIYNNKLYYYIELLNNNPTTICKMDIYFMSGVIYNNLFENKKEALEVQRNNVVEFLNNILEQINEEIKKERIYEMP